MFSIETLESSASSHILEYDYRAFYHVIWTDSRPHHIHVSQPERIDYVPLSDGWRQVRIHIGLGHRVLTLDLPHVRLSFSVKAVLNALRDESRRISVTKGLESKTAGRLMKYGKLARPCVQTTKY